MTTLAGSCQVIDPAICQNCGSTGEMIFSGYIDGVEQYRCNHCGNRMYVDLVNSKGPMIDVSDELPMNTDKVVDEVRLSMIDRIKNQIQLKINFDPDDKDYIVTIPNIFPLVSAFADTRCGAIDEMLIALDGVLEFLSNDELADVCDRLEYLS